MAITTSAQNGIYWHGIDRQCSIDTDIGHKGKYIVRVVFTKCGYNERSMEHIEEVTSAYVIVTNLSHKDAKEVKVQLEGATSDAFAQGYSYARKLGH